MDGDDMSGDGDVVDDGVDPSNSSGGESTVEDGDSSDGSGLDEGDGFLTDEEVDCAREPTVRIHSENGLRLYVQIDLKSTVEDLKSAIFRISLWPVRDQRLIYRDQLLKSDRTLESYGIEEYQVVQLVNSNSTSRKAGSNKHRPCEMNKPSTPNTEPLPNPWTSTVTGGRSIISGVDLNVLADRLSFSDPKQMLNPRDCRVSSQLSRRAYNRFWAAMNSANRPAYNRFWAAMNSANRPQAERRQASADAQFNPMAGMDSSKRPQGCMLFQVEGRRTNAGAPPNPMPGMTSASKPQAERRHTNADARFNPMAGTNSARRPQGEGRQTNAGAHFNPEQMPGSMADGRAFNESSRVGMNPGSKRPEQYAARLLQLLEMGFINIQRNIKALASTGGDVQAAVDRLLGSPEQN